MGVFWALLKTVRPRQWVKNISLLAAAVFSGFLFLPGVLLTVFEAMVVFTLLASGVYLFNDLIDIEKDRIHPFKMKRPIASGKLPVPVAILAMVFCLIAGLSWAYQFNFFFFLTTLAYVVMQILYSLYLKKIPIVDVMVVASGYVLRIYAGAVVINVHMDVWFLLTVVSASLFLAIGKRRSEMTLLKGSGQTAKVRITLKRYTEQLLDVYTSMFANATWLTYALFTFNHPKIVPQGRVLTLMSDLPRALMSEKLLMITTPLVIFGVMRYLQLIYEKNEGESPERIFLSDKPLIITVLVWGVVVVGLLYKFS
jgi:4-hydroxybenzoate polyprenyltransferase